MIKAILEKPKEAGIYAFRINKQFRVMSVFRDGVLLVFEIDNHQ
jgi:plasmid maintenance system killer protein